jgi:hypothetical protein
LTRRVVSSAIVIIVIICLIIVVATFIIVAFNSRRLLAWEWAALVLLFFDGLKLLVSLLQSICPLGFSLFRDLSYFSKIFCKTAELSPGCLSGFNQIGEWKYIERILPELAIVVTHVNENTLLVS